jgi:GntR family transcriptional regulator/MocR family aminotransferase
MPPVKLASELSLPLALDRASRRPLQQQLREQLRQAMLDGRLASGTRLPSTRALAQALGVSRTVTISAYGDLFAEGYLAGPASESGDNNSHRLATSPAMS